MSDNYVDFKQVKETAPIEQVLQMLGITLKKAGEQLRGKCPICNASADRAFVVTPAKNLWYCFSGCGGGDTIKLVSRVKKIELREAALFIQSRGGTVNNTVNSSGNSSPSHIQAKRAGFDAEKYLQTLDPAAPALEGLGIAVDTLRQWKAGYSSGGVNRGKLALPVAHKDGTILGYMGRTLKDESPLLSFPNGIAPYEFIFGADRVTESDLYLVRDPLDVLRAWESGVMNAVAFLTQQITPQQLEMLAALCDERKVSSIELY